MLQPDIVIKDQRWLDFLPDLVDLSRAIAVSAFEAGWREEFHGAPRQAEAAIVFVDDALIRDLNARYRKKNRATNVLSFPVQDWEHRTPVGQGSTLCLLGDVLLAREAVHREAKENNTSPARHVRHLIVHGILHLLGYDHEKCIDAERMEMLETMILEAAGDPDPYECESGLVQ